MTGSQCWQRPSAQLQRLLIAREALPPRRIEEPSPAHAQPVKQGYEDDGSRSGCGFVSARLRTLRCR
jgi:hypothetical protein